MPGSATPGVPGKPTHLGVKLGDGLIVVSWYRPKNDAGVRDLIAPAKQGHTRKGSLLLVLGYVVRMAGPSPQIDQADPVTGHMQLISTNDGGRVLDVIGGLVRGQRYRFSISAVNPAGTGPAEVSPRVTAK